MTSSKVVALCVAALAVLAPAPAAAVNPDAQAFFSEGRRLRHEGDCDRALVAFRRALESAPEGLGALRNIAECQEQLGRYASARAEWSALRRAVVQRGDPRYSGWDRDAEGAYQRLEGKVGKIVLRLRGDDLGQVKVTIDALPLDPALIGVEVERDPGPHVIEARRGAAAPIVTALTLAAGAREEVSLVIPASPPDVARGDGGSPGAPSGGHAMRNAGIGVLGITGVTVIGAIAALAVRQSALSSIGQACPGYGTGQVCPASVRSDLDTGRTASVVFNAFTGLAVVGLAVGVPLVVAGSKSSGTPATKELPVTLGALPAAGGATAWARMMF